MSRVCLVFVCCFLCSTTAAQNPLLVAPTGPLTPDEQQEKFHLPAGFHIELVASEPEIQKPLNLAFDAKGRLWVTQTVEYPYPAKPKEGEEFHPRDRLGVIVDTDSNGVPDKASVFARDLNIPIGVVPMHDSVICHSIPRIFRLTDTDGDGKADSRDVLYSKFGYDDTHGMVSSLRWWVDGWIYGCHGFRNESTVQSAQGGPVTFQSGNTYRLRPDGAKIEYYTHGQVNPFGMCIDPLGNVYTSDCHTKPVTMLLRGAWYESFGKPHDGLGFGPQMIKHSHGSTGIAGVVYYAANHFPAHYRDSLFIGNPVTGKVNHDLLERSGSTYRAVEQPDFLTCDDPWFRPVDVQLAPDGSLYIADFYNKIIGHYEVPLDHPGRDRRRGRIWRITYVGDDGEAPPHSPAPDLTTASTDELLKRLMDPNLVVRTQATHQLVHRVGEASIEPLKSMLAGKPHAWQRAHAIWVLHRLGKLDAATIEQTAADADRRVRVHLMKALAERPWESGALSHQLALTGLKDPDAFVGRAAAEALGLHPHSSNIDPLLNAWADAPSEDTHLIHAIRIALRNNLVMNDLSPLAEKYRDSSEHIDRLADVCLGVREAKSAQFVARLLREFSLPRSLLGSLVHHACRYVPEAELDGAINQALKFKEGDLLLQEAVTRSIHRACQERSAAFPDSIKSWAVAIAKENLQADDNDRIEMGLALARDLRLTQLANQVESIALEGSHLKRPLAIQVLPILDGVRGVEILTSVVTQVSEPMGMRKLAADTLGLYLTDKVQDLLVEQLKVAPHQLASSVAYALSRNDAGSEKLLTLIESGVASPHLLQDGRVAHELHFRTVNRKEERIQTLVKNLPPIEEKLRQLADERKAAFAAADTDSEKGRQVFEKNCAACHRIGDKGGKVGPQLDGVGVRGVERILEDILLPNRNVDHNFRSTLLALADGSVVSGLLLREEGAVLVLADDKGQEQRIPSANIEERKKTTLSPMPTDVAAKLPEEEFCNLLAYLLQQRQPALTTQAGSTP